MKTHKSQSTAIIKVTSDAGNPTAVKTISIVTRPAEGIVAAPTEAKVAVKLKRKKILNFFDNLITRK